MRRVATAALVVGSIAYVAIVGLQIAMARAAGPWVPEPVILALGLVASAAIGTVILRRTGNMIGWIFLAFGTCGLLWFLSGEYLVYSTGVAPLPMPTVVAIVSNVLGAAMVFALALICPLFPTGHLPSTRWRWILWLWWTGFTVSIVWNVIRPGVIWGAEDRVTATIASPFDVAPWLSETMVTVGAICGLTAGLAGVVSLVLRARRATGEERLQIRWLSWVAGAIAILLVTNVALVIITAPWDLLWVEPVSNVMFGVTAILIVIGVPIAVAIAILKYKLFEIDAVIRKTVVFGLLAGFFALVYGAIVGGLGAGVGAASNGWFSFLAAATLALLFQPARDRARVLADRLVYGKRATPYEVLAEFSGRLGDTYDVDDVLTRMARILAQGTGATNATVWLSVGGGLRPAATFPPDGAPEHAYTAEVRHQGELLGELSVTATAADPMNPAKEKLVADLAAQAGLVLRNVRLIEELKASRQRLVAAQDEERRRLERNLHDGAQQQLVALAVQLKLAEQMADRDLEQTKAMLRDLGGAAGSALEDLRDLARGIYPPLLADKGLRVALEAQARKAAVPSSVDADGVGRYHQDAEAAVYFCVLEALNNVAKYAEATHAVIRLSESRGGLVFDVVDDGRGFDPAAVGYGTGLQGIADRLAALDGTIAITSAPGAGTTVTGTVPVEVRR
jgi:signal transduction histidine kinase